MKKFWCLLAAVMMIGLSIGTAESAALRIEAPSGPVRPGEAVILTYWVPENGNADLTVLGDSGETVSVVFRDRWSTAGQNALYWNGTYEGKPAPEGEWTLCLEMNGERATAPVKVAGEKPALTAVSLDGSSAAPGDTVTVRFHANAAGTVTLTYTDGDEETELARETAEAGDGAIGFEVSLRAGQRMLTLILTDAEGTSSEAVTAVLTVVAPVSADLPEEDGDTAEEDADGESGEDEKSDPGTEVSEYYDDVTFTPSWSSPYEGQDPTLNYWTLPMDITDEDAVWKALTAPITVLDKGSKNSEKTQVAIRRDPDAESEGIGVVTCETQSVHVLERGDEWTLIECYSSSFYDSKFLNWNTLVQGYVPTKYLKTVTPNQSMGFVIDKLTQRLYIFRDGKLYTTLLASTGLANDRQPYNETRSGEFILTSKVGTFASDNLKCGLAIRFNKGDLLHEVPYTTLRDGGRDYKRTEAKLGTKASHGCIRVQRKKTPEGVNMEWIWNNVKQNSKIKLLIWEDWQGRQIEVPPDGMTLYYNPSGGSFYHSADHCYSVQKKNVTLEPFTYGELDSEPYSSLTRCEYCCPALRKAEIEAINETYAWGGDHDPVLTRARESCPKKK